MLKHCSTDRYHLNIIIALHCEAKPIIEGLGLKKISHLNLPFPIFVSQDQCIHLVIAGVGKVKAAAATTFIQGWIGNPSYACFLNVGISGSTQFQIGNLILAHKIIEESTQRAWYPFISLLRNYNQGQLITYDLPQSYYPPLGMIDMEGSAFFQTASLFVSQEQVQVVKIISDGDAVSQQQLNKAKVEKLVSQQADRIIEMMQYLKGVSQQERLLQQEPQALEKFKNRWYFTTAQKLILKECLRRWQLQKKDQDAWDLCQYEIYAEKVINKLIQGLDSCENHLY